MGLQAFKLMGTNEILALHGGYSHKMAGMAATTNCQSHSEDPVLWWQLMPKQYFQKFAKPFKSQMANQKICWV